jgi:hypothetical protein
MMEAEEKRTNRISTVHGCVGEQLDPNRSAKYGMRRTGKNMLPPITIRANRIHPYK